MTADDVRNGSVAAIFAATRDLARRRGLPHGHRAAGVINYMKEEVPGKYQRIERECKVVPSTISAQSAIQVVTANGRVNVRDLADAIDVPMDALAGALGKSTRWLNHDPEAVSIQAAAISIVQMMNELAQHLGEKRYALFWLKTPQREFGNQTPIDYLRAGHLDLVLGLANDILQIVPD